MESSKNFITYEQLEKIIDVPFSDIREYIDSYVHFKGLVRTDSDEVIYVDGYFIVGETEILPPSINADDFGYYTAEPDIEPTELVIDLKGCEYSNNNCLLGKSVKPKSSLELQETLFSFQQLSNLMETLGCPPPKSIDNSEEKHFSYDVDLVNQKSNFTLNDAAKIAANIYTTSPVQNEDLIAPYLFTHYLELLSDCVKGTNQHKFKLHTVELWCETYDEFGDAFSRQYENGTYLKQKAAIDCELTVISKQEFVRWCDYVNVDTGLTYHFEFPIESIEALQSENEKLSEQVRLLRSERLSSNDSEKRDRTESPQYPPELQLAIDVYEQYVMPKQPQPTSKEIQEWLVTESKKRGIVHHDGATTLKGLSSKKKEAIASIVKQK